MKRLIFYFCMILLFSGCSMSEKAEIYAVTHDVEVKFTQNMENQPFFKDTLIYYNARGQHYMVNDLQYFISKMAFHTCKGRWILINTNDGIHYTDIRFPGSDKWVLADAFPLGCYDSIGFVFGMDENDNISNRYSDPPMRDMFWPEILGGGYHHIKMNLKWKNDSMTQLKPFMFHLGTGQMYNGGIAHPDSIIGFIQNHFKVQIPCKFDVVKGKTTIISINMDLNKWFHGENDFDFSQYPMGIMQNQSGMFNGVQNGKNAFSAGI